MTDPLDRELLNVIDNGNCSGCGVCPLISTRVTMSLEPQTGYLRPVLDDSSSSPTTSMSEAATFRKICPGRGLAAPQTATYSDPDFGGYESVWEAWATDAETRHGGSSAGVLTALSAWLISTGRVPAVVSAGPDQEHPYRSSAVRSVDAATIQSTSGSRYSPVSSSGQARPGAGEALIAKPCEVAGFRALEEARGLEPSLLMSFFCAGTPSQKATTTLMTELGFDESSVAKLRYRGNGWPGDFEVVGRDGRTGRIPYASAWSRVLGRQIETRCRVCADGTGQFSDLVAADFWEADEKGYPKFTEADGRSAVIARTPRGHETLLAAAADGVIEIRSIKIAELVGVQPAQTARQRTMVARLAARLLMRYRIPRYRGFKLRRHVLRYPVLSAKHFVGTLIRTRQGR